MIAQYIDEIKMLIKEKRQLTGNEQGKLDLITEKLVEHLLLKYHITEKKE